MNPSRTPSVRFKGYEDEWEERKLGDTLTELKSGLSRMLSNNDIGLPVVRANNINDGQFNIDSDVKYWYVNDPQGANTVNYLIRKNDILINFINSEAKMGTATIVENTPIRDTIYTTNILRARLKKEYDSYYWFALTQINQYKINIKIITKPAVNQASFTTVDFKKLNFMFPNLKEQQKIGSFFKQLDDTIALHQRKLNLLNEQKKGFLQKMFPKNGEKIPEIRFAGFNDDWEERKLGEAVKFINGRAYKQHELLDHGKYRVLRVGNFNTNDRWYYSNLELDSSKYANTGDLLYLWATSFGPEIWSEEKVIYHYHIWKLLIEDDSIDKQYLYTWLLTDEERIRQSTNGTTMVHVTKGNMEEREFQFPTEITEQRKIGTFFKELDQAITLHQRKIDELKSMKKSMLQKMFV
ncbi:restriction endonuclease subunit S [Enterococcus italicus]|uniref:restriction endonuclease subunit S n=1 Tax=Enterococcus italicus TaxID=246144 RepID=UPI002073269F|nr:restriction endonuclease subunit S [Enterococcus italicus]MCM6930691.1 restriction endonuclease subunit S [Enterococcus italicus]